MSHVAYLLPGLKSVHEVLWTNNLPQKHFGSIGEKRLGEMGREDGRELGREDWGKLGEKIKVAVSEIKRRFGEKYMEALNPRKKGGKIR